MSTPFFGGSLFVLVGVYVFALALKGWSKRRAFVRHSEAAAGTVVEMVPIHGRGTLSTFPKVRFATAAGETREFLSSSTSAAFPYRVGASVRVLYDPSDPEQAEIDSASSLWSLFILQFIMAAMAIGMGVLIIAVS
jgi:hypothetical protein